jgi:hypothetical protein
MPKIQHTGKQYTVTISEENIKRMKWKKGTEVYIAKDSEEDRLYIEEMPKVKNKGGGKNG